MFIPFPDHYFEIVRARNIPDARNAIVASALHGKFDYLMMLDADHRFRWDLFLLLWEGIKKYGDESIITAWAKCKTGMFEHQPCVMRKEEHGIHAVEEAELRSAKTYLEVHHFGTCGFLAPTKVFKRFESGPYFTDVNVLHPPKEGDELLQSSEFLVGQDLWATHRFGEAGIKMYVATEAFMPHEQMGLI